MFAGILLALLSGVLLGICFLPMRYMKQFAWVLGLGLSVVGVAVCAVAGSQRDYDSAYMQIDYHAGTRMTVVTLQGIALSIDSGLLTPLQNLGIGLC